MDFFRCLNYIFKLLCNLKLRDKYIDILATLFFIMPDTDVL